jgi:hypothetical protein
MAWCNWRTDKPGGHFHQGLLVVAVGVGVGGGCPGQHPDLAEREVTRGEGGRSTRHVLQCPGQGYLVADGGVAHPTGSRQVAGGGEDPVGFEVAAPVHLGGDPQHLGVEQVDRPSRLHQLPVDSGVAQRGEIDRSQLIDGGAKRAHPAAPLLVPTGAFALETSGETAHLVVERYHHPIEQAFDSQGRIWT